MKSLRRALPLAAFALPVVLIAAVPQATGEPGLVYDFRVTTTQTDANGKSKEVNSVVGRGQVAGTSARIDLDDAKNGGPMAAKGAWVVVNDGAMLMFDPKEKSYYEFNMEQMMAGVGSVMQAMGPMMRMTMSDVAFDVQDLGAGEKIQGYETQRVRVTHSYTMSMSVLGRKSVTKSADTTDYHLAPALKHVVNPFLRMGNAAAAVDFGNADMSAGMKRAQARLGEGLPLKSVTRATATDEKGKVSHTVMQMEVTNLRQGDVPSSVFAIPAGYKQVAMPFEQLAALGDSLEAARAAAGTDGAAAAPAEGPGAGTTVREAAGEAVKAGAAEEAKRKLRGVLRKP